jgi:sugar lactone lactonase YvrE
MLQLVAGLVFPEAPRWRDGKLWFADVHAHRVCACDAAGRLEVVARFDDKPSGLGFLPDGSLLVALMRGRRIARVLGGTATLFADLGALPWHELNDMVVDGLGRIYVGAKADPQAATQEADILLIRPDGSFAPAARGILLPNGMAVSADAKRLIVAETRANRLTAFDIAADGTLVNRRLFAQLESVPDGICLDAEGCVWVGTVWDNEFLRVREGGEVTERVVLADGKWAVACALGGPQRNTLFMLTAHQTRENLRRLTSFEADLTSASKGYVETTTVNVPGSGWP